MADFAQLSEERANAQRHKRTRLLWPPHSRVATRSQGLGVAYALPPLSQISVNQQTVCEGKQKTQIAGEKGWERGRVCSA